MGSDDDGFEFEGTNAEECRRFIHYIRGKIRQEGKRGDDEWIMELVCTCLVGEAIDWEASLDPEVSGDWSKFQKALLARYVTSDNNPGSSGVPTPAAAPPLRPSSRLQKTSPLGLNATHCVGWIRIIASNQSGGTFISRRRDHGGRFVGCMEKKDALLVCFRPSEEPHTIETLNSSDPLQCLGGHRYVSGNIEKDSSGPVDLCATNSGATKSSRKKAPAIIKSHIWTVSSDLTVHPIWEAGEPPIMVLVHTSRSILLSGNHENFLSTWVVARLVFELADQD